MLLRSLEPDAALKVLRGLPTDIDRYVALRQLQADDEAAFYRLLSAHTLQLLPWVYTPTVGQACTEYCARRFATRGLYVTADDAGRCGVRAAGHLRNS